MIPRYVILQATTRQELGDIQRASQRAQDAFHIATQEDEQHSPFFLDSAVLNLCGFYAGLEHVFETIAREVDGRVPSGPQWHRDLLNQMSLDVPGFRPPILAQETRASLEEYLNFRHLVRNIYTWNLSFERLGALVEGLSPLLVRLQADTDGFFAFLEAAAHADE